DHAGRGDCGCGGVRGCLYLGEAHRGRRGRSHGHERGSRALQEARRYAHQDLDGNLQAQRGEDGQRARDTRAQRGGRHGGQRDRAPGPGVVRGTALVRRIQLPLNARLVCCDASGPPRAPQVSRSEPQASEDQRVGGAERRSNAMVKTTDVLLDGLAFPEGPRWREGVLWFSDMHDQLVKTVDLDGRCEAVVRVENDPSGLGWLPDRRLLVVSMRDRRLLRLDPDGLREGASLPRIASHHCHDMVTDARGRSYVGNFGFDFQKGESPRTAALALVYPDGRVQVAAEDLSFPNGTVITPDGRTLIVGESFAARLTAFDVAEDGSLSNRRIWAQLEKAVPDGICLDAEGAIWVASPMSNEVLRVREGGEVAERIRVATQAIACMLGGPKRTTLFVCTSESLLAEDCRAKRSAKIEVVEVSVPGAGLP